MSLPHKSHLVGAGSIRIAADSSSSGGSCKFNNKTQLTDDRRQCRFGNLLIFFLSFLLVTFDNVIITAGRVAQNTSECNKRGSQMVAGAQN